MTLIAPNCICSRVLRTPIHWVSVGLGLVASVVSVVTGVVAAYALHKCRFPGQSCVNIDFPVARYVGPARNGVAVLLMLCECKVFDRLTRVVTGTWYCRSAISF